MVITEKKGLVVFIPKKQIKGKYSKEELVERGGKLGIYRVVGKKKGKKDVIKKGSKIWKKIKNFFKKLKKSRSVEEYPKKKEGLEVARQAKGSKAKTINSLIDQGSIDNYQGDKEKLMEWMNASLNKFPENLLTTLKEKGLKISVEKNRNVSAYNPKHKVIKLASKEEKIRDSTLIHEVGHALDYSLNLMHNKEVTEPLKKKLKKSTLKTVTLGEKKVRIAIDDFIHYYAGRVYPKEKGVGKFREYMSMGIEYYLGTSNKKELLKVKEPDLYHFLESMFGGATK